MRAIRDDVVRFADALEGSGIGERGAPLFPFRPVLFNLF